MHVTLLGGWVLEGQRSSRMVGRHWWWVWGGRGLEGGDVVVVRGRYCCLGVTLKKAVGLVLFVGQSLDGGGCC